MALYRTVASTSASHVCFLWSSITRRGGGTPGHCGVSTRLGSDGEQEARVCHVGSSISCEMVSHLNWTASTQPPQVITDPAQMVGCSVNRLRECPHGTVGQAPGRGAMVRRRRGSAKQASLASSTVCFSASFCSSGGPAAHPFVTAFPASFQGRCPFSISASMYSQDQRSSRRPAPRCNLWKPYQSTCKACANIQQYLLLQSAFEPQETGLQVVDLML